MDSIWGQMSIFDSDRIYHPTLRNARLMWFKRLESFFPTFVKESIITPSCIRPYGDDLNMVGPKVIIDNGGYVKAIFTVYKDGRSASISPMER